MRTNFKRHDSKAIRILAAVFLVWFCTVSVSFLLLGVSGYDFLPSPFWAAALEGYDFTASVIGALAVMIVMFAAIYNSGPGDVLKKIAFSLVAPYMGYHFGHATLVLTWPMIVGLVGGSQVELTYIVESADREPLRRCGYSIEVRGVPDPYDQICHVPQSAREGLVPGSQILARGRGTRLGIYLESWNRME